jgi:hypothetical protein
MDYLVQKLKLIKKYLNIKFIVFFLFIILSGIYYRSFVNADISLISRVRGFILLQVQKNGEAWYIDPHTDERYYLGRPADAYAIMRDLGVGITNSNINRIPVALENIGGQDTDVDGLSDDFEAAIGTNKSAKDTDNDGHNDYDELVNNYNPSGIGHLLIDKKYADTQIGKILIQVEQNGEAWYVYPEDSKRYYLGRPAGAFAIMRQLGLGINNSDLASIPTHLVNEKAQSEYITNNYTAPDNNNDGLRIYSDPNYPISFSYPSTWKIKKSIDSDNVIFLGDYEKNLFGERKGMITITHINSDKDLELKNFEVVKKDKAEKTANDFIKINGLDAYQQKFYYPALNSYDITTVIKKNAGEFLHLVLVAGGAKEIYDPIYKSVTDSTKFTD